MRSKRRRIGNKKQSYFRRLVSKPSYSAGVIDYRFSGNRAGRRDWDDVGIVHYEFCREVLCFHGQPRGLSLRFTIFNYSSIILNSLIGYK